MTRRIILSPDAEADIASAIVWYQRIELSLGFRFKAETRATLRRIAQFPYQFPLIEGKVRRAHLKRFRYAILFSLEKEGVFVKAIVHERQDDSTWKNRGNGHS
ncbi:MAG TPA: type II toxin-antitoxin system RelE/ParE family toxin [Pyrinomonadaceae bacterium]|jgi:plasmid stabilization system protein ParE|nr:type II toxin-antitoxin system RelE/ParE family toxin [Pyrinomonadaceae bacterium]